MTQTDPVTGPGADSAATGPRTNNLMLRALSALVMAPVAIATAYYGGWPFAVFWGAAAVVVLWEWLRLVAGPGHNVLFSSSGTAIAIATLVAWLHRPIAAILLVGLGALAAAIFTSSGRRLWVTGGIAYAGSMLLAPMILREDEDLGFMAIAMLFAIVWTTDIFAYFAGRTFGGPKLWPAVSPKKTWSGAIAGTLGAVLVGIALPPLFGSFNLTALAVLAFVLSVLSQLGDLFESAIKRHFGAKDASHLIPGHGGVMDRLDGFWAAALAACVIGILHGGFDAAGRGLLVW